MTIKVGFTKQFLIDIPPPEHKSREYYYDAKVNGLLLQVTKTGAKSFQVYRKVERTPVRVTLGRFPDMTIDQARRVGMKKLAEMAEGINPNEKKKEALAKKKEARVQNITLNEVYEDYLILHDELTENTLDGYQTMINKYIKPWLSYPLNQITGDMIAKKHKEITKLSPSSANKTMRVVRALFNFAKGEYMDSQGSSLFPENPTERLSHTRAWNKEKRRQKVIERSELKPWFDAVIGLAENDACFNAVARDYFLFILFTGLRRREAGKLKWVDVNMSDRLFTFRDTKNGTDLKLPYSDFVESLIEKRFINRKSDYVFSGGQSNAHINDPRKQITRIREESGVYFTIHDLRRTFITIADSLDIPDRVTKRLVNHSEGNDVTAGYVIKSVERLRKPVETISLYIESCFRS